MKMFLSDRFTRKLNGQELGRLFGAERMLGKRRVESRGDTEGEEKEDGQNLDRQGNKPWASTHCSKDNKNPEAEINPKPRKAKQPNH